MLKKTASKWPVRCPPASDAGSDATLSHPPVASGLVPDESLMFPHTLLEAFSRRVKKLVSVSLRRRVRQRYATPRRGARLPFRTPWAATVADAP